MEAPCRRRSEPCGCRGNGAERFRFRDLVECGESWQRLAREGRRVDNLPLAPETVASMEELCRLVLDPIAERFGRPELTYGFASPALTRHIHGRIYPSLDQHAGSERGRSGKLVCARQGLAVDLRVPGVSSREVAAYVVADGKFDRLYFYGADRPLHVSVGERSGVVVEMRLVGGRLVPRQMRL